MPRSALDNLVRTLRCYNKVTKDMLICLQHLMEADTSWNGVLDTMTTQYIRQIDWRAKHHGWSALHVAGFQGNGKAVERIVSHCIYHNNMRPCHATNPRGMSVLMCIARGHSLGDADEYASRSWCPYDLGEVAS
jgi:hypothetical protein